MIKLIKSWLGPEPSLPPVIRFLKNWLRAVGVLAFSFMCFAALIGLAGLVVHFLGGVGLCVLIAIAFTVALALFIGEY